MNGFIVGPYTCSVCDEIFTTTLDLADHNETTGHLNQVPVLKRIPKHTPISTGPKIRVRKILRVRVDLGDGYFVDKEVSI